MTSLHLKCLYNKFNKKYFKNQLPDLYVHYGKLHRNCFGKTRFKILCKGKCERCYKLRTKYIDEVKNNRLAIDIIVSDKLKKSISDHQSVLTLLHEMIHVSIGGKYQHGPKFRKEMKRLLRAGAYNRWL